MVKFRMLFWTHILGFNLKRILYAIQTRKCSAPICNLLCVNNIYELFMANIGTEYKFTNGLTILLVIMERVKQTLFPALLVGNFMLKIMRN